jgi:hypothetical protein
MEDGSLKIEGIGKANLGKGASQQVLGGQIYPTCLLAKSEVFPRKRGGE